MKIYNYIRSNLIFLDHPLSSKDDVLQFIADGFIRSGVAQNSEKVYQGFKTREQTMSTGIGDGIAIPHTFSQEASEPAVMFIRLNRPINFESLDSKPVDIIAGLIVPENMMHLHIQLLAGISRLFRNRKFMELIRDIKDSEELLNRLREIEGGIACH